MAPAMITQRVISGAHNIHEYFKPSSKPSAAAVSTTPTSRAKRSGTLTSRVPERPFAFPLALDRPETTNTTARAITKMSMG